MGCFFTIPYFNKENLFDGILYKNCIIKRFNYNLTCFKVQKNYSNNNLENHETFQLVLSTFKQFIVQNSRKYKQKNIIFEIWKIINNVSVFNFIINTSEIKDKYWYFYGMNDKRLVHTIHYCIHNIFNIKPFTHYKSYLISRPKFFLSKIYIFLSYLF